MHGMDDVMSSMQYTVWCCDVAGCPRCIELMYNVICIVHVTMSSMPCIKTFQAFLCTEINSRKNCLPKARRSMVNLLHTGGERRPGIHVCGSSCAQPVGRIIKYNVCSRFKSNWRLSCTNAGVTKECIHQNILVWNAKHALESCLYIMAGIQLTEFRVVVSMPYK